MCVPFTMCVPGAQGGKKRASDTVTRFVFLFLALFFFFFLVLTLEFLVQVLSNLVLYF